MNRLKFLLGVMLCATLMVGCNSNTNKDTDVSTDLITNPNSANGYDDKAKVAVMTFDSEKHDFGMLTSGENIAYSFHFRNTGSADLVINGCEASCGCTVADYPRQRIAPGKDGYVTITFKSAGKMGMQYQEVKVSSNAQPGMVTLKILAQVR